MPVEIVSEPRLTATFDQVPVNPVKSSNDIVLLVVKATVSEPADTFNVLVSKTVVVDKETVRVPTDPA